ncbi:hypothetical protein [Nocardioides bruguierae]|uniref:Uncharacterized protein n=1 Tax=Nocardioides bruguierae TaxID=2945102 RepID=A0A9X2D5E0_9ACTN|nr:hypothetical protein [Nocardioides bruguierae]MCM0619142.1 hypothetical protein [Nocardioides bruguierae]
MDLVRGEDGRVDVRRTADAMAQAQIAAGVWPWWARWRLSRSNLMMTAILVSLEDSHEPPAERS